MKVTNDRVKSVIYSKNRDFRPTAIQMLNSISYTADKISVNSLPEIKVLIAQDKMALNIVVDVSGDNDETIKEYLPQFKEWTANKPNVILIWHSEQQANLWTENTDWESPNIKTATLPQAKQAYAEALRSSRDHLVPRPTAAAPAPTGAGKTPAKPAKPVNFFEASAHVKDAIDYINRVMKDKTDTQSFATIGQRFNGIIGSFQFFGDRAGYRELAAISDHIDTVTRLYNDGSLKEIKDNHLSFVLSAAKCAYLMLKDLRETEKLSPDQAEAFMVISHEFESLEGVKKKERHTQEDIDSLLEEAQKAS